MPRAARRLLTIAMQEYERDGRGANRLLTEQRGALELRQVRLFVSVGDKENEIGLTKHAARPLTASGLAYV